MATLLIILSVVLLLVSVLALFSARKIRWIFVSIISIVLFTTIIVIANIAVAGSNTKTIKNELYDKYNISLLSDKGIDYDLYNRGNLIGPIIGDISDNRLYDIYIRKDEDNQMIAYIRNEKGAYIPITNASIKSAEK